MTLEELKKKIDSSRTTYFNVLIDIDDADRLLAVAKAAEELLEESTPVPNVEAIQVQQKYVEKLVKALAEMEKA